ncbi:adenylyltransferase/cytidyltransferase family protein [Thermoproteota archaeon]
MISNGIIYEKGKLTDLDTFRDNLQQSGISKDQLIGLFGGRFMPFHNGHNKTLDDLTYHFDRVHIGIVNPDPWDTKLVGERYTLDKNFLTYNERNEMINAAVDKLCKTFGNVRTIDVSIAPYYPHHVYGDEKFWRFTPGDPERVIHHIAVRDDFDRKKKERAIESKRTFVQVPLVYDDENKPYGATMIRKLMVAGIESWRDMMPDFTADVIDRYNIVERLKDLTADERRKKE